jgi:rSAM/selenodomain-associated transferase 2
LADAGARELFATPASVAAVVPTLNEGAVITGALQLLVAQGFAPVIVVDGRSDDDTLGLARSVPGVVAFVAAPGRGPQMNAGAAASEAEAVVFVHADTSLPTSALALISQALSDPRVVGGSFRLAFDKPHPLLAISCWFSRFDSYWTTFGDQAVFVRRSVFEAVGGFPDWPILEDVEFRRRLLAAGRLVKLPAAVTTSARRFLANGVFRRQVANGVILALHALGVPARRLQRWYR